MPLLDVYVTPILPAKLPKPVSCVVFLVLAVLIFVAFVLTCVSNKPKFSAIFFVADALI